jgi:hypothetical protein
LILEDGGEAVRGVLPPDPRIRYASCTKCHSLGDKRNLAAELSWDADYIAHWDDDDWSAPERLAVEAGALHGSGHVAAGFRRLLFWDEIRGSAFLYQGTARYVPGSTLLYRRDWWKAHPFAGVNVGEDNGFVAQAASAGRLLVLEQDTLMVATTHMENTSPRNVNEEWKPLTRGDVPAGYFA